MARVAQGLAKRGGIGSIKRGTPLTEEQRVQMRKDNEAEYYAGKEREKQDAIFNNMARLQSIAMNANADPMSRQAAMQGLQHYGGLYGHMMQAQGQQQQNQYTRDVGLASAKATAAKNADESSRDWAKINNERRKPIVYGGGQVWDDRAGNGAGALVNKPQQLLFPDANGQYQMEDKPQVNQAAYQSDFSDMLKAIQLHPDKQEEIVSKFHAAYPR